MGADLLLWHFDYKAGRTKAEDNKSFKKEIVATRERINKLAPSWDAMEEMYPDAFQKPLDFEMERGTATMVEALLKAQDKFRKKLLEDLCHVQQAHDEAWRSACTIRVGKFSVLCGGGFSPGDYPDEGMGGLCEAIDHLSMAGVINRK